MGVRFTLTAFKSVSHPLAMVVLIPILRVFIHELALTLAGLLTLKRITVAEYLTGFHPKLSKVKVL